jgi:hypothetical protein
MGALLRMCRLVTVASYACAAMLRLIGSPRQSMVARAPAGSAKSWLAPRHAKLRVTSVPDLVRISQRAGVSPARNPA